MHTRPLGPFGVEVLDIDLRGSLDDATGEELRELFRAHHLLLVRGQDLEVEDQIRFTGLFGPLLDERADGTFHSWVSNTREDASVKYNSRLPFHSDLGFTPKPYLGVCLYATEIDGEMPTVFADTVRGCASLPEDLRHEASIHDITNAYSLAPDSYDDRRVRIQDVADDELALYRFGTYPIIDRHPVTSEPFLRFSEMQTSYVVGLPEPDSEALIARLGRHLYADDNVVSLSWRVGDVAVWDNVALQHGRPAFGKAARRTLRRVTIATHRAADLFAAFDTSRRPAQAAV